MSRAPGIYLCVDRDGWTGGVQISIDVVDADGGGHGHRLAGPKYNGSSKPIKHVLIGASDRDAIRQYLKLVKTPTPQEGNDNG